MSREAVIGFLRNGQSQMISFSFVSSSGRTITVNGSTFRRVADAMEATQGARVNLVETTDFPREVAAEYAAQADPARNIPANTLRIRPNLEGAALGELLHESVHASFDLTRSNGISAFEEEAAAYIAEGLYYRRIGIPGRNFNRDSIRIRVQPIVNSILQNQPITQSQIANLVSAIRNHRVYATTREDDYLQDG